MPTTVSKLIKLGTMKYRCPICLKTASHVVNKGENEYLFTCDANRTIRTERAVYEMFSEFSR